VVPPLYDLIKIKPNICEIAIFDTGHFFNQAEKQSYSQDEKPNNITKSPRTWDSSL
jgi:hypothetical protein